MALKFRRGTTAQKSGSLAFGEPYVNTSLGTLQIGLDTGDVTLATTGTGSSGNFGAITGTSLSITGNASIDGNLTLGGTITIGDNTSDNVVVNADLSSSIIPNNDNAFDLGSASSRYRAIYGTNLYGAINATNGVVSGSSQIVGILSSLNTYTGSNDTTNALQTTRIDQLAAGTASVNSFTSSQSTTNTANTARFQRLEESTASLNAFSASENTKAATLQTYTASVDTKFAAVQASTASLNTFTASNGNVSLNAYTASNDTTNTTQNTRLTRLEESTASLNAFSASNNTTNTLQTTRIDQLAAGTSSVNLQTASVAGHISDINTYTSSLKTAFSVSGADLTVLGNLTVQGDTVTLNVANLLVEDKVIEIASGSTTSAAANGAGIFISGANASILWDNTASTLDINKSIDVAGNITLTGTVDGVDVSVQDTLYTNKFSTLQTLTASMAAQVSRLQESTASLNAFSASENTKSETLRLYTASVDTKFTTLATYTGSNDTTNTTQNTRLSRLEESTASLNAFTASENTKSETLRLYTASIDTKFSTLQTYTASVDTTNTTQNTRLSRIEESTASLNVFSASENTKSETLRLYTASIDVKFSTLATYTGSNDTTNTTQNTRLTRLEESTSSLNTLTASLATTYESRASAAKVLVSGSSQVNFTQLSGISANIISGSTNSTNVNFTISGGSITANLIGGVVSGSSQITAGSTTNFANDVKTQLNSNTVVSGSVQVVGILTSLNTYTASNDTTNTTQNTRLSRLEESTASLNVFSASENTKSATLQTYTASVDSKFSAVQASTASLNTFTASNGNVSLNSYTASNDTTNTTQNTRLSRLEESTASLNSLTSSYARTNSTNTFSGNQTITGSLFITQDLIVGGSSSIQNISASRLDIGDNIIQLNVNNPVLRFGGIAVFDSGSAGGSGSFLYDSVQDEFIFVHRGNGTNVTSSHFVLGPETYDNLGNETYLTNNRLPKGTGKEHLVDSQISDDGTTVSIGGALTVTGNITGPIRATNGIVSGSSQIVGSSITTNTITIGSTSTALGGTSTTLAGLTSVSSTGFTGALTGNASTATTLQTTRTINGTSFNGSADITIPNLVSGSSQITAGSTTNFATDVKTQLNSNTVVSGSSQVIGILSSLNTYTGSNDTTNTAQNSRLSRIEESTSSLNTLTASLSTTYEGRASAVKTLFSGSSQVSHDSTTGYSANRHVDHTAVSISAGSGLTGGGDISTTRTISVATGGVTNAMLAGSIANDKLTNSSITIAGQSTALGGTVTAETIRTAIGTVVTGSAQVFANVSGDVTIASNGVATIAANSVALGTDTTGNYMVDVSAGSGISISHTQGEGSTATITNSGVRSIAAGTGVSVSATTGDNCSIAIGQSVATSASPTFAGLTINGSITATGDITAYFSSDKRFKDNVQIIPDALSKVRKINGVTWEWNDLVDDVTKQSPNTGLIAQEVQQVLPEVVKERGDGHLGLDYSKMMGLLVEAIKEQQNKIDNLSIEIENLKKQKGL